VTPGLLLTEIIEQVSSVGRFTQFLISRVSDFGPNTPSMHRFLLHLSFYSFFLFYKNGTRKSEDIYLYGYLQGVSL